MLGWKDASSQSISLSQISFLVLVLVIDGFVKAMELYGFPGLSAFDIVTTGKQVRNEMALTDPEKAAGL
jgi:hypothetical protein